MLHILGVKCRITEIEFYFHNNSHLDPFVHINEQQKRNETWYFHRAGKSINNKYKGGTYKGLDIIFGNDHTYGGMLIRSMNLIYY